MRKLRSDKEIELRKRIEYEHAYFKYRILSKGRSEIYDACNQIRVTECVYEYVIYNDNLKMKYIDALFRCDGNILDELYGMYLQNEFTEVGTWKDIEEFLNVVISEQGKIVEVEN